MVTLNSDPSIRTHGKPILGDTMRTRTNNLATSIEPHTPDAPDVVYAPEVQKRIDAAISRAKATTRRAHYLGHNTKFGFDRYEVYSWNIGTGNDKVCYYLYVYTTPTLNAFRYLDTPHYIRCDCEAAQKGTPCWHGAKVAIRLSREARRRKGTRPSLDPGDKPRIKHTLESLYED